MGSVCTVLRITQQVNVAWGMSVESWNYLAWARFVILLLTSPWRWLQWHRALGMCMSKAAASRAELQVMWRWGYPHAGVSQHPWDSLVPDHMWLSTNTAHLVPWLTGKPGKWDEFIWVSLEYSINHVGRCHTSAFTPTSLSGVVWGQHEWVRFTALVSWPSAV